MSYIAKSLTMLYRRYYVKLKKGDKLYPPAAVRGLYWWWDAEVFVVTEGLGVYSLDGDFYDGSCLIRHHYLNSRSSYCFKHVSGARILENE